MDGLFWALSAAILTYVWRVQDLYPIVGMLEIPTLASLAAVGFFIVDGDRRRSLKRIQHPITILLGIIFLLAVLSVPTSIHDGRSFRFIVNDLGKNFILTMILAASVRHLADVRRYVGVLLVGAVLYSFFVYTSVAVGQGGRLGDIVYYDANDLGMMLVSSLPLAIFFLTRGRNLLTKAGALFAVGLMILVIVKTGSRGAFLGLVALALYFLFAFKSLSKKLRVGAVVAGIVALTFVGGDQYWSLMETLLNPTEDYNWQGGSDSGRMEVWKRGMGYMFSHPITGVGVRGFPIAEGHISELAERQQYGIGVKWSAAHNSFVQIGAELGILGLAAFIALLYFAVRTAQRIGSLPRRYGPQTERNTLGHALAGSLVGYIVVGFFLSQAYAVFLYFLLALVVGLQKVAIPEAAHAGGRRSQTAGKGHRRGPAVTPASMN